MCLAEVNRVKQPDSDIIDQNRLAQSFLVGLAFSDSQ